MGGYQFWNRLYACGSLGLMLLLSALVLFHVLIPPAVEDQTPQGVRVPTMTSQKPIVSKINVSDFGRTLEHRLRPVPPPIPATTAAPVTPPPPPPPVILPDLKLMGTALESEPSESRAWLQLPNRPMILAKQGDVVESIEGKPLLKNVEQGKVVLVFGEQEKVLEIKSPFP
jgi:hypothetical protein